MAFRDSVRRAALLIAVGTAPFACAAKAQTAPTSLLVRVVSHDAKIIGSGVGGAQVTIKDAATGRVLASGIQEGSTGNTDAIIRTPWVRGGTVYDTEGAAHFRAELNLTEPTLVEVTAVGPLGAEQGLQRASKTVLMVPGVDVLGEGLVVELNGFTVAIEEASADAGDVQVRARVTMLCGCPTEPGGLWDADRIRVVARLLRGGEVVSEASLGFAGETSIYTGSLPAAGSGGYEVRVFALDPTRANTGMATRRLTLP